MSHHDRQHNTAHHEGETGPAPRPGEHRNISGGFSKQKTVYEIPKRDWSSDVCSSDLCQRVNRAPAGLSSSGSLVKPAVRSPASASADNSRGSTQPTNNAPVAEASR